MTKKQTEYDALRALWYEKLKEEGFEDIESDDKNLKIWSTTFFKNHTLEVWQAKAAYYSMADKFLNDHKFSSELERTIWEYHANAVSVRDISSILKKTGLTRMGRQTVHNTIQRLENIMKKYYLAGASESQE